MARPRTYPKSQKFAALSEAEKQRRINRLRPDKQTAARRFWDLPEPATPKHPFTSPILPPTRIEVTTRRAEGRAEFGKKIEKALKLPAPERVKRFGFAGAPPTAKQVSTWRAVEKAIEDYKHGRVSRPAALKTLDAYTKAWSKRPAPGSLMPSATQLAGIEFDAKLAEMLAASKQQPRVSEPSDWQAGQLADPERRAQVAAAYKWMLKEPDFGTRVRTGVLSSGPLAKALGAAGGRALESFVAGTAMQRVPGTASALGAMGGVPVVGGYLASLPDKRALAAEITRGIPKVLAAGAAGVPGLVTNFGTTLEEGVEMASGVTQTIALLATATDPRTPEDVREANLKEMWEGTIADLRDRYGEDVTLEEAISRGYNEPLISVLNAAALLYPMAKGASIWRHMAAGARFKDAWKLSRDPARAEELLGKELRGSIRTNTVRPKYGEAYKVEINQSRAPTTRAVARGADVVREGLSRAGARGVPLASRLGESKALRTQRNRQRRAVHRMRADGAALWHSVAALVDRKPEEGTRLFWDTHTPMDVEVDDYMRMISDDIKEMLAGRDPIIDHTDPKERKLLRDMKRLRRSATIAQRANWVNKAERISDRNEQAQQRLARIDEEIDELRQAGQDLVDNPEAVEEGGFTAEQIEQRIERLEGDRRAAEQEIPAEETQVAGYARDKLRSWMDRTNVTPEQADDLMRVFDQRARTWARQNDRDPADWYDDPEGLGIEDIRDIEDLDEADLENVLAQQREGPEFDLQRDVTPEVAAHNLRYVEGGDLYKPHLGNQKNAKKYRTVNGVRVQVFGPITAAEWKKRVQVLVPTAEERDFLAKWYERVGPTLERFFGEDAPAIMRGFAVSQANASPSSGITAVLRVFDKVRRDEAVSPDEISTVVESIEDAIRGQHVSRGMAAKLHDFADSIQGKRTRTWMGNDPRGGRPTANDIHAQRDLGYIDRKLVERLVSPEAEAMFSRGFRRDEFEIDSGGSPGTHQYERMREQYEAITDHLNEGDGFDGRKDWTPAEVQALGWSAIQRLHGAIPEDLDMARAANTRRINLEVTKGMSGIGGDLSVAEATLVTERLGADIEELIRDTPGLYLDSGVEIKVSAYEGTPNASLHIDVTGSPEKTHDLVVRLADIFDQYDVWATRQSSSTGAKPTLVIAHESLADPEVAIKLHRELFAINPKRYAGYAPTDLDDLPGISVVMPGDAVSKAKYEERMGEIHDEVNEAVTRALGDVDYDRELRNTQIINRDWRSNLASETERQRLQGAEGRRTLDDPDAAALRQRLDEVVEEVRLARGEPDEPEAPPHVLAQTRRQDLLGAVQFLNTENGARVLYLSEHADASTWLHEVIGHSTREMKASYPEDFAAVERARGRVLEEWEVADHEWFARSAERYFADGRSAVPELVPVFRRLKTWIRSIYGGLRSIGAEVSPEINNMLDTYFGAYDDANVVRIAQMSSSPAHEVKIARNQHLREKALDDLEAHRKRKSQEEYRKSLEALQDQIAPLQAKLNRSPEEEERLTVLETNYMDMRAQAEVEAHNRERNLGKRFDEIQAALANPASDDYPAALAALNGLMDMRTEVLRAVFGDQFDEVFLNRVDLLSDFLVDRGLMEPDYQRGTARYAPHQSEIAGKHPRKIATPAAALETRVIGRVDQSLLNLHRRNNLLRYQSGDLRVDPMVIFEAWQNAQSFAFIHFLKDDLAKVARDLKVGEEVPKDAYVLNVQGVPISRAAREAMHPASTNDVQDALDALDGRDEVKTEELLIKYAKDILMTPERYQERIDSGWVPKGLTGSDTGLKIIDKRIVETLFRPLRGGASRAGQGWDAATTIARWSLIYSNPAYIPVNFIGNGLFLFAQQGPKAASNLVKAMHMLMSDKPLAIRVAAQTGELPAEAAISHGRRIGTGPVGRGREALEQRLGVRPGKLSEDAILRAYTSIPDKWPRMAAWIYEANRMGYRTSADLNRLLDGDTRGTARARDTVSERATEVMVNFDRLSDWEKQVVTRVLFIWPWIRGATAWPFYYAREFPVRTAVGANVALNLEERRKRMLGDVRASRRSLFPISAKNGKAVVANYGPISPTSTAGESIEAARSIFNSLTQGEPLEIGSRLVDYVNPSVQAVIEAATGRDSFGRETSLADILINNSLSYVPFGATVRQMLDPTTVSPAYLDKSWKQTLKRKMIRIAPEEVAIASLNAGQRGKKTVQEKTDDAIAELRKSIEKAGGSPNQFIPKSVRDSIKFQQIHSTWRDQFKEKITHQGDFVKRGKDTEPQLTPRQNAALAYAIVEKYAPEVANAVPKPRDLPESEQILDYYTDALLYGNADEGIPGLFQPLDEFRREIREAAA